MRFRIYADGDVVMEDDFTKDESYSDDYQEVNVPDEVVEYIQNEMS